MSATEYTVEMAKSGRSKCKRCKNPIAKGELRIGVIVPADSNGAGVTMTSYYMPGCFRIPRKFSTGSTKLTAEEFVRDHVQDPSHTIFPRHLEEVIRLVEQANVATPKKRKAPKSTSDEPLDFLGRLKAAAEGESPKKKAKTEGAGDWDQLVELYREHHKRKADELKDYLRWNRQLLKGNKDFVLFKVLDGMLHGRLGHCPLDGGRLKLEEDNYDKCVCMGRFDEDTQIRVPCAFTGDRTNADLRYQPFYLEEPTEEQKQEMDDLQEKAQGDGAPEESDAGKELLTAAKGMKWDLSGAAGIKAAAEELVELVKGKVDLPEGRDPKRLLGQLLMVHKDEGPSGVVQQVIAKYGFSEDKAVKAKQKEEQVQAAVANPSNAALFLAFQELSTLYFKEGNRNAGASYRKVSDAISNMTEEITADNAASFSKGKTKVPGIGKSSTDKMKEFLETGTMVKLEEKRALQA